MFYAGWASILNHNSSQNTGYAPVLCELVLVTTHVPRAHRVSLRFSLPYPAPVSPAVVNEDHVGKYNQLYTAQTIYCGRCTASLYMVQRRPTPSMDILLA